MSIKINDHVVLATFQGRKVPLRNTNPRECYELLIGKFATVLEINPRNKQALLLFDVSLDELNLINHNKIKNTLWINLSDLVLVNTKNDLLHRLVMVIKACNCSEIADFVFRVCINMPAKHEKRLGLTAQDMHVFEKLVAMDADKKYWLSKEQMRTMVEERRG